MNKLSQEEIEQMINETDSDKVEEEKIEEDYGEEFDKEPEEEIDDHFQEEIEEEARESPLNQASEVQSQIEGQNDDQIGDEIVSEENQKLVHEFKKDEDLSLAKSQFVESEQLNINSNLKERKQKLKSKVSKDNKAQVPSKKEIKKVQKKPEKKYVKQPQKGQVQAEGQKKEKLSESEIKEKMNAIKDQMKEIQRKKQEKLKKEEQARRKQYEEAKKLEQERKQKNRKILQEQNLKKKEGKTGKPKSEIKFNSDEVKLPQRRQITYMNMVKERKNQQKKIQMQIEAENKNKLKKILEKPKGQLKGQARKEAFKKQKQELRDREKKMRQMEAKEEDTLIIRQLKKEINQSRKFNLEKKEQINRAEKTISELSKKLTQKQKRFYSKYAEESEETPIKITNYSQLSPIQKFVYCFPEAKTSDEIFKLIDKNGDGVLSSEEIKQKLQEYHLQGEVIQKVEDLLDQNSDGTVSNQQFVFYVDRQMKRQKDYREIMGVLEMNDPLDLEAKIVDMQAKIRFITEKMDKYDQTKNSGGYDLKIQKLQKKAKKLQKEWKKQIQSINDNSPKNGDLNTNSNLANEMIRLRNDKNMKSALVLKLRKKVKDNLAQKNKLLASRVEENLRLEQEVFRIKNQIQESQLRYLSMKKIHENKKGYLERQSQKQKEMEEAYKKTKQFKISIADPSRKAQNTAERDEMRLLAAVIMIQRNYRRRKARGESEKLKAGKTVN